MWLLLLSLVGKMLFGPDGVSAAVLRMATEKESLNIIGPVSSSYDPWIHFSPTSHHLWNMLVGQLTVPVAAMVHHCQSRTDYSSLQIYLGFFFTSV